jgi:membrane-associated phospholipid phosphatase
VLATGNHFLLDIVGGLLALALSVWLVGSPDRLAGRLSPVRVKLPARLRRRREKPANPALRMSQSCYEVQDTVD